MNRVSQKLFLLLLTVLFCTGALTDSMRMLDICGPGTCACMLMAGGQMPNERRMHGRDGCAPEAPAPCCHITPVQTKTDAVAPERAPTVSYRTLTASAQAIICPLTTGPISKYGPRIDSGPPTAMPVPLYLMNLTILC